MDQYQRISAVASAIALGTGVVLANVSRDYLASLKLATWKQLIVEFLIISISILAIRSLLDTWLFLAPWIRRLFLGGQYVEGTWVDLVRHGGRVASIGIIQIRPQGSSLRYSGENYDLDGRYIGHFTSKMTSLSWPRLSFKYDTFDIMAGDSAPGPFLQGFGEIAFDETSFPPRRYHGDCIDSLAGVRHALEGWRIVDKSDLKKLRDPQERGKAILALAQRHFASALVDQSETLELHSEISRAKS